MISPHKVLYNEEELARQTGRTSRMIEALPEDGCFVVVWKMEHAQGLKRVLQKMRPEVDLKSVHFISAVSREQVIEKVRGSRLPVYVDHIVWTIWNTNDLGLFNISHKMESFLPK